MKTKAQKVTAVEEAAKALKTSQTVIFTDFTGTPVNEVNQLRKSLAAMGAALSVVKKRLVKIVFEKEKMSFDPKQFEGPTAVVFSPKDFVETANVVYKFSKGKEFFKILGGFDMGEKKFVEAGDVKKLGQLPGREALLGQLAFMLTVPIKKLLFVMNEQSKKSN